MICCLTTRYHWPRQGMARIQTSNGQPSVVGLASTAAVLVVSDERESLPKEGVITRQRRPYLKWWNNKSAEVW